LKFSRADAESFHAVMATAQHEEMEMSDAQILAEYEAMCSRQESYDCFRQKLQAAIEEARADGLKGDSIAHALRSVAYEVGSQWKAEMDRRNAERIAGIRLPNE
jgi:YesN/AraC family two-component response regulator